MQLDDVVHVNTTGALSLPPSPHPPPQGHGWRRPCGGASAGSTAASPPTGTPTRSCPPPHSHRFALRPMAKIPGITTHIRGNLFRCMGRLCPAPPWAEGCRVPPPPPRRPPPPQQLFAIIQGGLNHDLRTKCIDEMVRRHAPGYAIGGVCERGGKPWPLPRPRPRPQGSAAGRRRTSSGASSPTAPPASPATRCPLPSDRSKGRPRCPSPGIAVSRSSNRHRPHCPTRPRPEGWVHAPSPPVPTLFMTPGLSAGSGSLLLQCFS